MSNRLTFEKTKTMTTIAGLAFLFGLSSLEVAKTTIHNDHNPAMSGSENTQDVSSQNASEQVSDLVESDDATNPEAPIRLAEHNGYIMKYWPSGYAENDPQDPSMIEVSFPDGASLKTTTGAVEHAFLSLSPDEKTVEIEFRQPHERRQIDVDTMARLFGSTARSTGSELIRMGNTGHRFYFDNQTETFKVHTMSMGESDQILETEVTPEEDASLMGGLGYVTGDGPEYLNDQAEAFTQRGLKPDMSDMFNDDGSRTDHSRYLEQPRLID